MVDAVKELLQIQIHNPAIAIGHTPLGHLDRLLGTASGTKSVGRFREVRFEDHHQLLMHCLLDESVKYGGYPESALSP